MPLDHAALSESLPITCRNIQPLGTKGQPPTDAPEWIWEVDHPYLHGHFAPIKTEMSADKLEVVAGEIPKDLCGAYYRNGPNQKVLMMPLEASSVIGSLAGIAEIAGEAFGKKSNGNGAMPTPPRSSTPWSGGNA